MDEDATTRMRDIVHRAMREHRALTDTEILFCHAALGRPTTHLGRWKQRQQIRFLELQVRVGGWLLRLRR